jgi:hypothetical protein
MPFGVSSCCTIYVGAPGQLTNVGTTPSALVHANTPTAPGTPATAPLGVTAHDRCRNADVEPDGCAATTLSSSGRTEEKSELCAVQPSCCSPGAVE